MFWQLPKPPSLEELARHIPRIAPVRTGEHRPFWSVMIPTYNCAEYLRQTLASVLCQAPGPEQMQIEVIDDCSTKDDPERVVAELAAGRVQFYRQPSNQGAGKTFNTCINRARGHWVHILHGDDAVLPGFYREYERIISASPDIAMIAGKVVTIDENDSWKSIQGGQPGDDGDIIPCFVERQATGQLCQFAGVVVRRDVYEKIGGFCTFFSHVQDMDMWFRVGFCGPVAGTRRPYALYRQHSSSDTNRLAVSATNVRETYLLVQTNLARLSDNPRAKHMRDWRCRLARSAERFAWSLDSRGCTEGRLNQARWAWMLDPTLRSLAFYAKSWLKHRLYAGRRQRARIGRSVLGRARSPERHAGAP